MQGKNFNLLENVLKNSMNPEHRAAAAQIIAYSLSREKVADCLLYAINDPDDEVRNNATRALGVLAGYITFASGIRNYDSRKSFY